MPGTIYFVTSCLHDSIPARGQLDIRNYQDQLRQRKIPPGKSREEHELECWKLKFARIDNWLDQEPAARHLSDPRLAKQVFDSLLHFAGVRYDVFALVVMPSHFHWVFRPCDEWVKSLSGRRSPREHVMHSIKGYSAARCNSLLGKVGRFWQDESYDHWVRDADELERIIYYVENNPVKAGLISTPTEWANSSARVRADRQLEFGAKIPRLEYS